MDHKYPPMAISKEALEPRPDVVGLIQRRQWEAYIEGEKAKLAAITSPGFAELFYMPTAFSSWFG